MKRTFFAFLLLFLCIGICLLSDISVEKYVDELMMVLEETESDLLDKNFDKALNRVKEADAKWEQAEFLFGSLSESLLIENMDLYFNSLPVYIEYEDTYQALIVMQQCKTTLEEVRKWQKVNLKNIF